jgi:glycine betaine catabolism A
MGLCENRIVLRACDAPFICLQKRKGGGMNLGRIDALIKQRRAGHTLPQGLYTETDAFDFDMAAIYGQSWLMVGLECELPKTGSYISMMVGKWPVIVTRDRDGTIRAFHNSCRHRGSMVCALGSGTVPKLVCPYHRWTYDLDGSLFAAGRMPDDFEKSDHGLKPVALENVDGALFICLSDTPPAFAGFKEKLAAYAAPHHLKDSKLAFQSVLVEHANWKLVMENGRECYHCSTSHPELAKTFPVGMSKHFDSGHDEHAQAFEAAMEAHGLPQTPVEGHWWQVARFALNEGCVSISGNGQHLSKKLMCSANGGDIGSMRWALDPHCFAHATADHVFMFSAMPVGPNETHVTGKWYVHKDAVEGVDYDVESLTDLWTKTNLEDKALAENNQLGVNSLGYMPGPYSQEAEMLAQRFTDWYCDKARDYIEAHGNG